MSRIKLEGSWYEVSNVGFDNEGHVATFNMDGKIYILRRSDINDAKQWASGITTAGGAAGVLLVLLGPLGALLGGIAGAVAYLIKNEQDEGYYEITKSGKIGKKFNVWAIKRSSSLFQE